MKVDVLCITKILVCHIVGPAAAWFFRTYNYAREEMVCMIICISAANCTQTNSNWPITVQYSVDFFGVSSNMSAENLLLPDKIVKQKPISF